MAETSTIEWTDATWNPITGCTMVSAGCTNCYAMGLAATRLRNHPSRAGLTRKSGGRAVWTGEVRLNEDWIDQPLRWRRPRRIFVCAHGDLFHEAVPDEWIDRVFAVMALAPQHTFQVLTKRPERARAYLSGLLAEFGPMIGWSVRMRDAARKSGALLGDMNPLRATTWPLPNVWLGTSIEDQATADARIPHLLATPAAVRFLSSEPLLGSLDLTKVRWEQDGVSYRVNALGHYPIDGCATWWRGTGVPREMPWRRLDWVIVGGESGPGARPMHPDWARSLRDQCQAAGVAFFFKQWGEWLPLNQVPLGEDDDLYHLPPLRDPEASRRCRFDSICLSPDGTSIPIGKAGVFHTMPANAFSGPRHMSCYAVGKKAAGRLLDGRTWDEVPA